jgi:hypothetical protein
MKRYLMFNCLAIAACLVLPARADVSYEKMKEGDNEIEVVRMTVTPAAEPVPALRYRLVARDFDLQPGNAAPYYYRAMIASSPTVSGLRKKYGEGFDDWCTTTDVPISKLPLDKVRAASHEFDDVVRGQLEVAVHRRNCDWELGIDQIRGVDVISFLLPEFQQCREMARILVLRTRLAVADRRYDDAIGAIRMNYRLGHDAAQPFLVCGLIGIAIDGLANRSLVELIANPDSPNMYWALGELPDPPIDLRPTVRFEMGFGSRMFPFIHNSETTDHSPQEWNRLLTQTIHDLQTVGAAGVPGFDHTSANEVESGLAATAIALLGYSHAKEKLIAQGMDRERVEKMAVGQVIAIYTERNYRRFSDDWENLWQVPFGPSVDMARRLDQKLAAAKPFGEGDDREILPMGTLLLPALQASREAQVRLDREVASLRVIEALRMHAATHDGKLPERLEDINEVPVPNNPATGKPFAYRLNGTTAILELPPSDRLASGNCRYEIQIAAKK